MRSRLKELVTEREKRLNRRIHQLEIALETGINPNTLSRWMTPVAMARIEASVAVPLCRYFECGLDDLIEMEYMTPDA